MELIKNTYHHIFLSLYSNLLCSRQTGK